MKMSFPFLFLLLFAAESQAQETEGQVAAELTGKWCYLSMANGGSGTMTSSCISLNADGSYEFVLDDSGLAKAATFFPGVALQERDYGTWSAEGLSIHYRSANHGQGSFHFEKVNQPQNESTPMIVIDGQAFASATPHDPW